MCLDIAENKSDAIAALKQLVIKWETGTNWGAELFHHHIIVGISPTNETHKLLWEDPRMTYPSGNSEKGKG